MARRGKRHDGTYPEALCFEMRADSASRQLSVYIRIFPETCEESLRRSFSYGDVVAAGKEENGALLLAACFERGLDGIVLLRAVLVREAETHGGTGVAERGTIWQTDGRAEIHKCLVEQSRISSTRVGGGKCRLKCTL